MSKKLNIPWIALFFKSIICIPIACLLICLLTMTESIAKTQYFPCPFYQEDGSGGKWGYINEKGKIEIEPQFKLAGNFSEGLAGVLDVHGASGYIDVKGRWVIKSRLNYVDYAFTEGLVLITSRNKFGYMDSAGRVIVEPMFDQADDFSEGLAAVQTNGKWGFIDRAGNIVIEPKFDSTRGFSEGLASVQVGEKYFFIDRTGTIMPWPGIDTSFHDGLAAFKAGNKFGFIDRSGAIAIEPKFEIVGPFREGLSAISSNGKWGFIDKAGNIIVEPKFEHVWEFSEGFASVSITEDTALRLGYIDAKGEIVFMLQDELRGGWGGHFQGGFAQFCYDGLSRFYYSSCGFVDIKGRTIIKPILKSTSK